MPNYTKRVIWSEEDRAWIATVPEFPGISAAGASDVAALEELGRVLEDAVGLYAESGWTLPDPAAPSLDFSGQLRLRLPRSLHAFASQRADDEGVSLNTLLLALISSGLGSKQASDGVCDRLESLLDATEQVVVRGAATKAPSLQSKGTGKRYKLPRTTVPEGVTVIPMWSPERTPRVAVALRPDSNLLPLPEEAIK